jgi:hypothetical protein
MLSWQDRPLEVANLLNPAFCGRLLYHSIKSHEETSGCSLPYALAFLPIPLVLHRATRSKISGHNQQLHVWVNKYPDIKIGLGDRARNTVPFTREALMFMIQLGHIRVGDQGALSTGHGLKRNSDSDAEIRNCLKAAEVVGKWLARAGQPSATFAMLGLKP